MPGKTVKSEPASVRVKEEKVRRTRAAEQEQANAHAGANGNGAYDEDQDAQGDENDDEEESEGSSRGQKRSRVNEEGDARPSPAPNGSQVSEAGPSQHRERVKTQPRDVDGFIPGSIMRIQLRNFVTYDWVEFRPGPFLNMILGPNGTGKSSIACAICLGLNWPPSVLGRASELNSFVKMGKEDGHIEIELKGSIGKPNLVIRRNLRANSKGSTFTLNGQSASGREINNKMAELNVQIGNLCSFLPQDKVSEFAAMSPQQLLKETQRAAGDERLTAWHDTLISAGKELKQLQELMTNERDQLKVMQERNEGLERDVQRYNERKKIEHDIELLTILVPVSQYREKRDECMRIKEIKQALHKKVVKLKERNAPAHALLKTLETQFAKMGQERDNAKKTIQAKFNKMKVRWEASEKLDSEMEDQTMRLERLKSEEKDRFKKIKRLEVDAGKMQAQLEQELEVENIEDVVNEQRQLNLERQDVILRSEAAKDKIQRVLDQKAEQKNLVERGNHQLRQLDDVEGQKLRMFQNWDKDHFDALMWLRNNKDKFQMEVFEPPVICLTVPNKNFVDAVEACFSANQLKTFVPQCQADFDTFNNYLHSREVLGRKVRINTWYRPNSQVAPPPMSREELAHLGFDGYAMDYVECPDGLRYFLQREAQLHRTAIGLNAPRVKLQQAMEAVVRIGPNGQGSSGASFIAGMTMNQVSRSRYGRRAVQTMARDIRRARNLGGVSVDQEFLAKTNNSIREAQQQLEMLSEQEGAAKAEYTAIIEEDKVFKERKAALDARKKAIVDANNERGILKAKFDRATKELAHLRSIPSAEQETKKVRAKLLDIAKKRIAIVKEYLSLVHSVTQEQMQVTQLGLRYTQISANKAALKELCEKKDERFNRALAEFARVNEEYDQLKAETKAALDESRDLLDESSEQVRQDFNEIDSARNHWQKQCEIAAKEGEEPPPKPEDLEQRTTAELLAELEEQRNRLELNLNTNPGVVEQYERRKQEIENMTKTLDEKQKKADKIDRNIKSARENWKPALETLVGSIGKKFSAAFDRIGCAGEIRISENEDYEKWAIDILVKFRDSEKLQLLTGQRQSGGERSLTTILYLMSLTEEARAPFSLVDEINQGMDQRAERNVHNSMVEVTCKPDSAQYFLITPKLLPDLNYHERMRILCVNNGEWLPERHGLGNLMNMINNHVAIRGRPQGQH
ncbi:hypothetical protein HGRIS_010317 [Hohenbuehelia grisea]|uniref:Structural maintenance of chromosomes protein 5 n=1 Tax=Hohenbuehelia grisea TaxID=104357 RepID=A0ABR3J3Z1_9AGAR